MNTMEGPSAPYVGGMSTSKTDTEVEEDRRLRRGGWENYPDLGGPVAANLKRAAWRGKPINTSKSRNGFDAYNIDV